MEGFTQTTLIWVLPALLRLSLQSPHENAQALQMIWPISQKVAVPHKCYSGKDGLCWAFPCPVVLLSRVLIQQEVLRPFSVNRKNLKHLLVLSLLITLLSRAWTCYFLRPSPTLCTWEKRAQCCPSPGHHPPSYRSDWGLSQTCQKENGEDAQATRHSQWAQPRGPSDTECLEISFQQGMAAHTCSPSTGRHRQEKWEFETT